CDTALPRSKKRPVVSPRAALAASRFANIKRVFATITAHDDGPLALIDLVAMTVAQPLLRHALSGFPAIGEFGLRGVSRPTDCQEEQKRKCCGNGLRTVSHATLPERFPRSQCASLLAILNDATASLS